MVAAVISAPPPHRRTAWATPRSIVICWTLCSTRLRRSIRDHLARTLLSSWCIPRPIIDAVTCRTLCAMVRDSMPAVLWCADQMARSRNLVEGIYLDEAPPLPLHICTQGTLPDAFYVVCSLAPAETNQIEARVASQVQALRAMASMITHIR